VRSAVVVGAGVAGIAAATALAERGTLVTLLEAAPAAGGRARSFVDRTTHDAVDNGQHALMGAYVEFLHLLRRLGRRDALVERDLAVPFWDARRGIRALAAPALPSPLHFAAAVARYGLLSPRERLGALLAGRRLVTRYGSSAAADADDTVAHALAALGQGAGPRRALWDPLTWATLNGDPERASARLLAAVVERALLGPREASRFLLPAVPLSELYAEPGCKYVEARGGRVRCSAPVDELLLEGGRAVGVRSGGERVPADAVVLAVPPAALRRLSPALAPEEALLAATPIVSVTLWLDRPLGGPDFLGLLGTETQWLFQVQRLHGRPPGERARLACVRSGADAWLPLPPRELVARAFADVRRALPAAADARLLHGLAVKEVAATLAPEPALQPLRPSVETPFANVFRAGDWVDTGLPATLESAALAGHRAAAAAAAQLR
jgi:squalene-associated FAD-dependent desaturase